MTVTRDAIGLFELLFLAALLVVVPLGIAAIGGPKMRLHPVAAVLAAASFFLPPGHSAALLALPWFLVGVWAAVSGLLRIRRSIEGICITAALLYLPVGGAWLVLSRWGTKPMGFEEPIVLLTAVHFHYAGFATPVFVAIAARRLSMPFLPLVAAGVIIGPALLAAGFVISPVLKLISALILASSLTLLATLILRMLPKIRHRPAQMLLAVSAASLASAMLFACIYAAGEFFGREWISIPRMAQIHGITNCVGFALCGLLAWNLLDRTLRSKPASHSFRWLD